VLRETWARRRCILNTRIYRKQASTTSKAHFTRRSLVTAEALGEVVSLVTIRVQVDLVSLLLISVLGVSLEVPPSKVLVACQVVIVAPAQEQALDTAESLPPVRVGVGDDDGAAEQERVRLDVYY